MIEVQFIVRPATEADLPVMQAALAHALDWRGEGGWESAIKLIESTGHVCLLDGWGRAGDMAVVADVRGCGVGAAWYRRWSESLHSYGYVDEATPEIGLGVDPGYRQQGIATALMTQLLALAMEHGISSLSLSVERDNPAVRLYRDLGFQVYASVGNAWTMRRFLAV